MRSAIAVFALAVLGADTLAAQDASAPYPFERFVGTWKLKDDQFQQVWDGETVQTLTIPGHRTSCAPVNTGKTVLCEVDAVDFQGHILWAFDAADGSVTHLSHFGDARLGRGNGRFDPEGNLDLRIRFTDEPDGHFRVYRYEWISEDEYHMMSTQHDADGTPTGNWYGGSFIRVAEEQ